MVFTSKLYGKGELMFFCFGLVVGAKVSRLRLYSVECGEDG